MKNLKVLLTILLLVVGGFAKANDDDYKLTKTYASNIYIEAVTLGKLEGFESVVDKDAKFCILMGNKRVATYSKAEMLEFMQTNLKGLKQLCTTNSTVVEENGQMSVLKVEMKYGNFTRTNYVTFADTGKGWKITNVCSVYK
ncbi:nuclear transport factor 2 family protein [Mucilaginibacter sp. UR6-1]|uniref:nuclear transport factor 2 family protein n=1 Tax=Mucilaginibacter sp. UR6-1 TaxID=1435643 RepID=UPI001E5ED23A|nr:nuclear transport factor 2 family protein [Mucilaginibacter sp. UR6-1]MCC8409674.1 nuclear transport factor 2 family protein [Mucilaginibacter sp. UR6-1]